MRTPIGVFIFSAILLVIDSYFFQAVKTVSQSLSPRARTILFMGYWTITVLSIVGFFLFVFTGESFLGRRARTYIFSTIIGLFLAKISALIFFVTDDLRRGILWFANKLVFNGNRSAGGEDAISRSAFLSWAGIATSTTLFGTLLYGFRNKYNYQVVKQSLRFDHLPESFRGLKIVHISDIHSGSFLDKQAVLRGVRMINDLKPDLILFTGDLVNDRASEMEPYMDVFSQLKAPMGVYSTLGNHDYGDYVAWPSEGLTQAENLKRLQGVHAALGWRLLMNEHVALKRGNEAIALIGIENWSAKARFPKHGRMDLAYPGVEQYPFKILMSHDPSHWKAQVLPNYPLIDLTLSGHTHGMQFGVEIPGLKWSPVQYMYKEWAGLYELGKQKLYVNRGFGFIGYPGRVGILPEITLIELT